MLPSSYRAADELEIRKLDGAPPPRFDCGRAEQNAFLHQFAWVDQEHSLSTTYLFYVSGVPAAYATVCMDALPLARRERSPEMRFRDVSAVKLAQLGVHLPFQGRGLGRTAVSFVVELARDVAERVSCRFVVLDAERDLVSWYSRQGFVSNWLRQEERVRQAVAHRRDPETIAVSMRFDVQ